MAPWRYSKPWMAGRSGALESFAHHGRARTRGVRGRFVGCGRAADRPAGRAPGGSAALDPTHALCIEGVQLSRKRQRRRMPAAEPQNMDGPGSQGVPGHRTGPPTPNFLPIQVARLVRSVKRSRDFYFSLGLGVHAQGCARDDQGALYSGLSTKGFSIGLWRRPTPDEGDRAIRWPVDRPHLLILVGSVEEQSRRIIDNGIRPLSEPAAWEEGLVAFDVADPDDHVIRFWEYPFPPRPMGGRGDDE